MAKFKGVIEYDGSAFEGFQRQKHTAQTVAGTIEEALRGLHINSTIVGSGRTDRGVHASNQVIDFVTPHYWKDVQKLKKALNGVLSKIRFKHLVEVDSGFHARFHAKHRLYRYIFKTTIPSVFERDFVGYYKPFDSKKLQEALSYFEGTHDFAMLCKNDSKTHTTLRTLYQATYTKRKDYHFIYFKANGFLRSQVRMMVHLAMLYAHRKITQEDLIHQINNKHPITTKLAPPQGLYLARVLY